ncbi:iron ABC transporter permease [Siculibacillus lacustris]|uniref:Iron ABC transporter permease n=1 Tax=Siculibacillus lacustris TaxID=1549641 RepID=A0A4Q9VTN5_9HYPH|nr:iron ABC transporter permease [Siculibacillus lacustris]TBW39478.1 iron ABC transporter permease [Siculibacillus lacustris]
MDGFPRSAKIWLVVAWAALIALPWYGLGGIPRGVPAWPAVVQASAGARGWLIPLILALIPATVAVFGRARPRLLVAAAATAILWTVIEGFAIVHNGWGVAALGPWFADPAPTQPALGWGALVFLVAMLMLIANGLARQGVCRGDVFVTGAILLVVALIALFVIYPALCIFVSAVKDNDGGFAPELFGAKLFGRPIWGIDCLVGGGACGTAWNTVVVATVVGVVTTLLGLAFALLALRTRVPMKPLIGLLSVLPIITPPFVIGLALILLFGRSGAVTIWVADLFHVPRTRWIYGVTGITVAQVLAFTPISFLVMIGVLQGVAPSLEEAAETLRAGRWRTFRTITWPLIRPGLANAFLIAFIESMADFANPLMIGGNFTVLSTDIFFAVVGTTHDQGRAAVLAIVLLTFTLTAFQAQRAWVGRRGYATMGGKGAAGRATELPGGLKALCYGLALPYLALTVAVYGTIMVGGFVESIGRDNTPTLRHLITAFSIEKGIGGWFLSGSAWNSLVTTFEVALIAMPFTAAIGIVVAWLLDRQRFAGRQAFEFLAMMSFAIPGTVIGVSYILAFNVPPLALTGTGTIIAIAFAFRNMPVGIRAGIANLAQIDRSLDEASLTLGARSLRTLVLVLLPLMRPAVTTALVYSFVRAVTAVSAVIFLVTGEYQLATVYIVGRADVGDYGVAIVYSAMLIVLMLLILLIIRLGVGLNRPGARPVRGTASLTPATMVQP